MSAELNIQLDLVNDRVDAGMTWLDANVPDWWLDINVYALDMVDGDRCVLGQLAKSKTLSDRIEDYAWKSGMGGHNGYAKVAALFDMGWDQPRDLGFLGSDLLRGEEYIAYTQALESRWFTVIINRQKQRLLPGMVRRELVKHGSEAA